MKKIITTLLVLCMLLMCSCNSKTEFIKAEHTYSLLGFTVRYNYPSGFNAVSSDDDSIALLYPEGEVNKADWSVMIVVYDMSKAEFEEYKSNTSKTAISINEKNDIWTIEYKEPKERTVMLKWFESGKMLFLQRANDFDLDDAYKIAGSFEIDVWGEDQK